MLTPTYDDGNADRSDAEMNLIFIHYLTMQICHKEIQIW